MLLTSASAKAGVFTRMLYLFSVVSPVASSFSAQMMDRFAFCWRSTFMPLYSAAFKKIWWDEGKRAGCGGGDASVVAVKG